MDNLLGKSVSDFFVGGFLDKLLSFVQFLFSFFENIFESLSSFYDALYEINEYIVGMQGGEVSSELGTLPIRQAIGLYRYLVTDPVFYLTYILILCGCLFTIYTLVIHIINCFQRIKSNATSGGKTATGLVALFKNLF
jgi:hypothetical protein